MNLLILNDDQLVADAMRDEIDWQQYGITDVKAVYSVPEGINCLGSYSADILLCDIEMPGQNGLELIAWIRQQDLDIDCILLTCHADFAYAQRAIALNCQDYILLPSSYENIGAGVLKVVARRQEKIEQQRLQQYGKSWLHEKEAALETTDTRSPKEYVEECIAYIHKHLNDENLSVNEIASHCYLNAIYLNRIFKKEKGTSISQYIIGEKMALAAHMLRTTNASSAAIAEQVGYPNYSYFSATFKKYYGCTPAQYKENPS